MVHFSQTQVVPGAQGSGTGWFWFHRLGGVPVPRLRSRNEAGILCQHTGERSSCSWATGSPLRAFAFGKDAPHPPLPPCLYPWSLPCLICELFLRAELFPCAWEWQALLLSWEAGNRKPQEPDMGTAPLPLTPFYLRLWLFSRSG